MGLPLLASLWDVLTEHPQLFLVALVVLVGVINAIGKQAKAIGKRARQMMESGGGGFQHDDTGGAPVVARRAPPAAEPVHTDPEELLPEFLRPGVWRRAQDEGVVEAEPPPARPVPEIRLEPIPTPRPARARRAPSAASVVARIPIEGESDVHRGVTDAPSGARVRHAVRAHGLLGVGRPAPDDVRRAVLWAEVIGPPRALRPYASPAAARRSRGPSAVAVVPPSAG